MDRSETNARYQGRPCKRGHSGVRYKANATCVECAYALLSTGKYNARNAERMKAEREANPKLFRERNAEWKRANRATVYANVNARRALKRAARCACCTDAQLRAVFKDAQLLHAEVDHRTPLAMGGAHCLKNLQILSPAAHRAKTARDQTYIRAWRKH